MKLDLDKLNEQLENNTTFEIIEWAYSNFSNNKITISTSFGAEGTVLLDMVLRIQANPKVFTIDTGRNFQETYNVWQELIDRYKINIDVYAPDPQDIYDLQKGYGPNLFYKDVELRKACCHARKVKPMQKALAGNELWISPLRREQSEFRKDIKILEWNAQHNIYKISPLAKWSESDVWDYIRNNSLPYNKLYDQGYPTIGCQPCSRPVRPAESKRSGRWWWEDDANKECGIHIVDGKVIRKKNIADWNI